MKINKTTNAITFIQLINIYLACRHTVRDLARCEREFSAGHRTTVSKVNRQTWLEDSDGAIVVAATAAGSLLISKLFIKTTRNI